MNRIEMIYELTDSLMDGLNSISFINPTIG